MKHTYYIQRFCSALLIALIMLTHVDSATAQTRSKVMSKRATSVEKIAPQAIITEGTITPASDSSNGNQSDFRVVEQLIYSEEEHHEELATMGFEHVPLLYEWFFFPSGHDRDGPITDEMEERIRNYTRNLLDDGGTYAINIENWRTTMWQNTSEERAISQAKLIRVIEIMKDELPSLKLGYYSMVPIYTYWLDYENCMNDWRNPNNPPSHKECADNQQRWDDGNEEMLELARTVDFFAPSIYTRYDDPEGWIRNAAAMVRQAERLNKFIGADKPIYTYIWPRYHGNSPNGLGYTPIPGDDWRVELETLRALNVDGVIIWDVAQWVTLDSVMRNEAWFKQTIDFIQNLPAVDDQTGVSQNKNLQRRFN